MEKEIWVIQFRDGMGRRTGCLQLWDPFRLLSIIWRNEEISMIFSGVSTDQHREKILVRQPEAQDRTVLEGVLEAPLKHQAYSDGNIFIFEKSTMQKSQGSRGESCPVCFPSDREVVDIMFNLVQLILKYYSKLVVEKRIIITESCEEGGEKSYTGVSKILKFIFNDRLTAASTCKHQIAHEFLDTKTKLPKKHLNMICQSIYQFQAKRNYELEVLTNQIKCFPRSIVEELNRKSQQAEPNPDQQQPTMKVESDQAPNKGEIFQQAPTECKTPASSAPTVYLPYYIQTLHPIHFSPYYGQFH